MASLTPSQAPTPPASQPEAKPSAAGVVPGPLSPPRRLLLIAAIVALTVSAYLLGLATVLLLIVVSLLGLTLGLIAARFGYFGVLARLTMGPLEVAWHVIRGLILPRDDSESGIPITREQAPELYRMVERLAAAAQVAAPQDIRLEMGLTAYVRLHGLRRAGRSTLGVGFDLLALLPIPEFEAVIAHELAHSRLVLRGIGPFAYGALARTGQLYSRAVYLQERAQAEERSYPEAAAVAWWTVKVAEQISRTISALSRHDEFEADAMGARLTSAEASRRALRISEAAGMKGARVSWKDRIIQVQRDGTLVEWLREKLFPADSEEAARLLEEAEKHDERDDFSTHPPTRERIAALGGGAVVLPSREEPPAITLLHEPDALARTLLESIRQMIQKREEHAARTFLSNIRKKHRSTSKTKLRFAGTVLALLALVPLWMLFFPDYGFERDTNPTLLILIALGVAGSGAACIIRSYQREQTLLPVPPLAVWDASFESRPSTAPSPEWVEERAAELRATLPDSVRNGKSMTTYLQREAYEALRECNYERALAAIHLLQPQDKSLEFHLAAAVALAWYRIGDGALGLAGSALKANGLGPSVSWAAAWTLLLLDMDNAAEDYLLDAVQRREDSAVLWSLLGTCQARLDRDEVGISSHRRAIALATDPTPHRLRLAETLLGLGRCREAKEELAQLSPESMRTREGLTLSARAALQLGEAVEAQRLAEILQREHPGPESHLRLAQALLESHDLDRAEQHLHAVNAAAYAPVAHVMLAVIAGQRELPEAARPQLLAALDMTRKPEAGEATSLDLLPQICAMLLETGKPVTACKAWKARVDLSGVPGPEPRPEGLHVLVTSPDETEGRTLLGEFYSALHPGATLMQSQVVWELLPKDRQPEGEVRSGIWFQGLE